MRLAALAAALVAAAVVPDGAPGVGIVVVALLVAVAARLGTGSSLDLWLFGTAALALAGIAALSDAAWVVAIDLIAALLLGTLAVGGATLLAPIAPARALRSVPEVSRGWPPDSDATAGARRATVRRAGCVRSR